jgi:hypothetical protein
MATIERAALLEFLEELSEPVGPWVFAGYGGSIAALRHRSSDFVEGEAAVEAVKEAWIDSVDVALAIDALLGIAVDHSPEASDAWQFELCDLLWRLGQRDRDSLEAAMNRFATTGAAERVIVELRAWLSNEPST